MLAILSAAGLLDNLDNAEDGPMLATSERTVIALRVQPTNNVATGIPLGAPVWAQHFDPSDHAPYAFDFSPLLADDERVDDIESIVLGSQAAAIGLTIDQSDAYRPAIDETAGKKVQLWFLVDPGQQQAAPYDTTGVQMPVSFRVRTSSVPPTRWQRTGVLVLRQL